ncbi:MAG: hypothetical protein WC742_03885 [Gallionellaceae bacterium]|jgi:hypothetical protein
MTRVMNMSTYVVEEPSPAYDDEVMLAGWNPELQLAMQQYEVTLNDKHTLLPASLVNADVETFLQKMYAYQR